VLSVQRARAPSLEPLKMVVSSGLKATATQRPLVSSVAARWNVAGSHNSIRRPSNRPTARVRPSGDMARLQASSVDEMSVVSVSLRASATKWRHSKPRRCSRPVPGQ
jgi:hypothetical protein